MSDPEVPSLRPAARTALSLLISLHLIAVVAVAAGTGTPASATQVRISRLFLPYLHPLGLDAHYRFYAPNPDAVTRLLYVRFTYADGRSELRRYPDRAMGRFLRMRYQRNLALTELMMTRAFWPESYARHLVEEEGAEHVTLYVVFHQIRMMADAARDPDAPDLYSFRELGTLRRSGDARWIRPAETVTSTTASLARRDGRVLTFRWTGRPGTPDAAPEGPLPDQVADEPALAAVAQRLLDEFDGSAIRFTRTIASDAAQPGAAAARREDLGTFRPGGRGRLLWEPGS